MTSYQGEMCYEDPFSGTVEAGSAVGGTAQGTADWYGALFPDPDKYPMPWERLPGPPFPGPFSRPQPYPGQPFPGLFRGLFD